MTAPPSPFDPIAGLYHQLWSDWYLPAARSALQSLFFSQLTAGAEVLDVCCGCGHVTGEIAGRGFRVTGVDASPALLEIAQRNLPSVEWQCQDIRAMQLARRYDAALSTFDSLNHLLSLTDLQRAFHNIHDALRSRGLFVFDMNMREAFCLDMGNWSVEMTDGNVSLVRGRFDEQTMTARTQIVWFHQSGQHWERAESVIEERCYAQSEIVAALQDAGFRDVECTPAAEAGMTSDIGFGRLFITARA